VFLKDYDDGRYAGYDDLVATEVMVGVKR